MHCTYSIYGRTVLYQTASSSILHFGDLPRERLQLVTSRDNKVLYRRKLISSDLDTDVDMRSASTQKNTTPSEFVVPNEAAVNCMGKTLASRFEPIAEGSRQTTQDSSSRSMLVITHSHFACTALL